MFNIWLLIERKGGNTMKKSGLRGKGDKNW
jgi:hypothetical protein